MTTSVDARVISLDGVTFDQWQSIGLAEGLVSDTEIGEFLIQMYDSSREREQLPLLCLLCSCPISHICDACQSAPPRQTPSHSHSDTSQPRPASNQHRVDTSQSKSRPSQYRNVISQSEGRASVSRPMIGQCSPGTDQSESKTCHPEPEASLPESEVSSQHLSGICQFGSGTGQPQIKASQSQLEAPLTKSRTSQIVTEIGRLWSEASVLQSESKQETSQPNPGNCQPRFSINHSQLEADESDPGVVQSEPGTIQPEPGAIQSEPGTILSTPGAIQSKLGDIQSKSGDIQPEPGDIQSESGVIHPRPGTSPSKQQLTEKREGSSRKQEHQTPTTNRNPLPDQVSKGEETCIPVEGQVPHCMDESPSWTEVLKEENMDEDTDEYEPPDMGPCSPGSDSPRIRSVLRSSLAETETPVAGSSACEDDRHQMSLRSAGQKKVWGAAEKKALTWFLDKYDVQSATGWKDCAVILNAALGTSTTGVECREQAVKGKLLTPKISRTGTKVFPSGDAGHEESQLTGVTNRKMKTRSRQGEEAKAVRRSPRRSKMPQHLSTQESLNNDHTNILTSNQSSPSSSDNADNTQTDESREREECKGGRVLQEAMTLCDKQLQPVEEDIVKQETMEAGELDVTVSQDDPVLNRDSDPSQHTSKLIWHYLGAADVEIPDIKQKRKPFKHSPNDRYKCKECASFFTHRGILVKHIRLVHLKWRPHLCPHCPAAYATKTKLQRHINVAHTKVRPFCCETCGASFVDHYTLICHRDTHTTDRKYRYFCELCGKGYYAMNELKRHKEEKHTSRPVKSILCWVCGKAVRTARYLRIHLRTHSPDKAFTCTDCCHVFTSKLALEKHRAMFVCQKHRDKKKSSGNTDDDTGIPTKKRRVVSFLRKRRDRNSGNFQCDICQKFFSIQKDVYRHKRNIHGVEVRREMDDKIVVTDPEEIARFLAPKLRKQKDSASLKVACDICSKRYSSQQNMQKHKNIIHFGRRDYKCDLCEKTFTRDTSLLEHKQNVHNPTGVGCDICGKSFSSKNNMIKHKRAVHYGFLPYSCPVCGKKFRDRYKLSKHQQSCGHVPRAETSDITLSSNTVQDRVASPQCLSSLEKVHDAYDRPSAVTDFVDAASSTSHLKTPRLSASSPISTWDGVSSSSGAVTPVSRVSVGGGQQPTISVDSGISAGGCHRQLCGIENCHCFE